jgi:hypothetical protein
MMKVGLSNLRNKLKDMHAGCDCECIVCTANVGGGATMHMNTFSSRSL